MENTELQKKERKPRAKKQEIASAVSSIKPFITTKEIDFNTELFDWKALIPEKYIEISNEWLSKNGIDPSKFEEGNKEELKARCGEENLIIKLAGFKHLAHLRGLISVKYDIRSLPTDKYVSAVCTLRFQESVVKDLNGKEFRFPEMNISGVANASAENTSYPFSMFLESMAENRAFIRAVKTACNINILGAEEFQTQAPMAKTDLLGDEGCTSPQESLSLMLAGIGKNFTDLKESLIKKNWENHKDWNDFKDIPSDQCCLLMEGIRAKL